MNRTERTQVDAQDPQFEGSLGPNSLIDRRSLLKAGAGLATAALIPASLAATTHNHVGDTTQASASKVRAYGNSSPTAPFEAIEIPRRAVGPRDVLLDILYCGVCHSDIHTAKDEWHESMPTTYPCVPGHEIVGRVIAVGHEVTKFRVGDIGGVGCIVDSCGECDNCLADREQNCTHGATFTYSTPDKISGGITYGGYSDKVVVKEHFVIKIPPGADLAAIAPLLCAGVTTFSPMQHWKLAAGQRVGVIGLGGLGHIAVKLAVARKSNVTVFTTTPGKVADAIRLGAKDAVLSTNVAEMQKHAGQYDLLISTVPQSYPMGAFINLLKLDGTLVNVGAMDQLQGIVGMELVMGRRSIAGSVIGGIAETQEVIDYCTARNIKADIELIQPQDINRAYERVINKDVRYRFVIDMSSLKDGKKL